METINVRNVAAALPEAWSSRVLGEVGGGTCVKVLRMDDGGLVEEAHDTAEALFVLDGCLELTVEGAPVAVRAGELYVVPPNTPHAVRQGSRGVLVVIERSQAG
ncbi:cupin domain-containing protein [Streptomyces syringium]|uniref:cupin domain-containing protein n=1 Tax=Streptomyces syringium TaxID=76729 RepID=UPI0033E6FAFF